MGFDVSKSKLRRRVAGSCERGGGKVVENFETVSTTFARTLDYSAKGDVSLLCGAKYLPPKWGKFGGKYFRFGRITNAVGEGGFQESKFWILKNGRGGFRRILRGRFRESRCLNSLVIPKSNWDHFGGMYRFQ